MRSGRRRILASLAALAVAPSLPAHAAPLALDELMARLAKVERANAEFVETKTLAALAKPLQTTGTLRYERPSRLERHTRTPIEERMTVAGDEITIEQPAKNIRRTFSIRMNPTLWGFIESIRATLAGDRKTLERFYWLKLSGDHARWSIDLEPRDQAMAQVVQSIRVSGSANRVDRVEVFEANGDRSDMRIKGV